ncbi:MAG: DUF3794 domain-containing protein, partial [Clostridiales bacterium]|nr:DUF3794 domain-containing protein [Clostridiales bacterium]
MELKRVCDTIAYWENTGTGEIRQTAQAEVIVPDTHPDVAQLSQSSAIILIEAKEALSGRAEIEGRVRVEILFVGTGEEPIRLETFLPFTAVLEDERINEDDMVIVSASTDKLDVRTINSRKLFVSIEAVLNVSTYHETTKEICKDIEEAPAYGIQRLHETNKVEMIDAIREKTFVVADRFEIERANSGAEEILRTQVSLSEQDHKLVGRKMILKGVLSIECLYKSFEGQTENASFELPFSQIMETDGNEDAKSNLNFFLRSFSFQPEQESYYEGRTLALKAEITVQAVCSSPVEIDRLEDVYSILYPMQAEYDNLVFGQTQIHSLRFASLNEAERKDKSKQPALVLRMTDSGEALWDLAHQYDTTVEAIALANSLPGVKTLKGGMLLIPVMGEEELMEDEIYGNIARRTGGNIYVGVVGPVRTGKST